ncbi:acyltransferase family protein [Paenibacillus protaetiae]|uniref:Acetyltransferase n=1 Tax=Paenibacillus protaetiae TaxID=2509456 RepID=A0A4V0YFA7_9BACL|nr:acyltransferase family protein [Paenibacillus protaetiae]QAY67051.1 acetyltransferase [Paenibacillus protaetiae]
MPRPVNNSGKYFPGLDGLRAIAVLAVIVYHLGFKGAPGGLLGVGIFFTLSGYLITDLMIGERRRNGRINMSRFWLRRARRLLPAMLLMIAGVSGWLLWADPSRLSSLRGEIAASVFYVANWRQIFHHVSYFESFGPPSPFGHLWSLAVEEQFYLLWPLLLMLLVWLLPKRGFLACCALVLAAGSAAAMAVLYEPGVDPSRVYYGTDTRAFGMLIGSALAFVWPSWKISSAAKVSRTARIVLDSVGLAGLAAIVLMILKVGQYDPFLYQGGMVVLSLATAAVVAVAVHPASRIGSLLGIQPLKWLGVRSYGIYLWHYPIIVLSTPAIDTGDGHWQRSLLQLAATLLAAAMSWKWIEEPIRHGALGKLWKRLAGRQRSRIPAFAAAIGVAIVVLCSFAGLYKLQPEDAKAASVDAGETSGLMDEGRTVSWDTAVEDWVDHVTPPVMPDETAPPSPSPGTAPPPAEAPPQQHKPSPAAPSAAGSGKAEPSPAPTAPPAASAAPDDGGKGQEASAPPAQGSADPAGGSGAAGGGTAATPPPPESSQPPVQEVRSGKKVTAIGDSIMIDIEPYLSKMLPGIRIDGKIGRQFREAQDIVDGLAKDGKLGNEVIIGLGSNGAFTQKQLNKLLDSLSGVDQVLLVNTRVPRDWQDTVNEMLADTAKKYDNVQLVDWYSASEGMDSYFAKDGVHLNKSGSAAYASLVVKALND